MAIRIKVGAALDRSTLSAFEPIIAAAKRARQAIGQEQATAAREERQRQREQEREAKRVASEQAKAVKEAAREKAKAAKDSERDARKQAAAEREAIREVEREAKRAAKERERAERDAYKASKKAAEEAYAEQKAIQKQLTADANRAAKDRAQLASGAIGAAGRGLYAGARAAGRYAMGLAGSLIGAAGVNTDFGQLGQKNIDLETAAVQLSNQGYFPGKEGPAGTRQNPNALVEEARATANKTGFAANDIIEAQQAFVSKTGDLEAARGIMERLGVLSKATGANLQDMADAAGDVNNALDAQGIKNADQRLALIPEIMQSIAAQGKEGAVEIKDLSAQMAKVAAAATQFEGGAKSIKTFGALTQFTRQSGGAASATQAATSVGSFMNVFSKGARLDAFQSYGVKVKGAGGKIRDPIDIITDALVATKGDNRKMGDMFADVRARSVTRPFETRFNEEYTALKKGGMSDDEAAKAAAAKVRDEFEKLAGATMSEKELTDSFTAAMSTNATKAQLFNNEMQKVTGELQQSLYPALVALSPMVVKAATALADAITTITGKDPREEAKKKKTDADVESVLRTQTTGTITSQKLKANEDAERDLGLEAERLRKKAGENPFAKRSFGDRLASATIDTLMPWTGGEATQLADRRARLEQSTKEGEAADARRLWQQMHDQNKKVADAVQGGALKVIVVGGTPGVNAPPGESQLPR